MQKIISFLIAICFLFVTMAPVADASVRIRKGRNTPVTPYHQQAPAYQAPYYQAPVYQAPYHQSTIYQSPVQITHTSAGSTYYYSPNYVAGYTYYSTPTPGYYYYNNIPTAPTYQPSVWQGQYYFSQNYISGYTYYSTPNPGYYYYFATTATNNYNTSSYNNNGNMICTIINNVYQCANNSYGPTYGTYPGCSAADIVIGGQIWASCNALDRNVGSTTKSGWFFAGDRESSFTSYNSSSAALEWMGKQTRESSWNIWPCATGYRLPNRGEWETLQSYARAGSTTVASLISLSQNGAYQGSRNTGGDITITNRLSVDAAYWTSSVENGIPIVMHIGSSYAGYTTDGTDYGYVNNWYQWTYTDNGLQLLRSTTGELANVRCIR